MSKGLNGMSRADMIRAGAAVVFFISSFLPLVGVTVTGLGAGFNVSVSIDAWHSYALLGVLLVLAAVAVWALRTFTTVVLPTWRVAWNLAIPVVAGIGTALIAIRAIAYTGNGVGLRYGAFLIVIAGIVFVASTYQSKDVVD
jgi:hypothetical protein